jgi:hypothetical protein
MTRTYISRSEDNEDQAPRLRGGGVVVDDRTLAALDASIRHWEENLAAEMVGQVDISTNACALCDMFLVSHGLSRPCSRCPVYQRTGQTLCGGTPYGRAATTYKEWLWRRDNPVLPDDSRDVFRAAARLEVEFLRSLRPGGAGDR